MNRHNRACFLTVLALTSVGSLFSVDCECIAKDKELDTVSRKDKSDAAHFLKQHSENFFVTFTIDDAGTKKSQTLRSLSLQVSPTPREPHAMWPNGQPVSADALISAASVGAIVDALSTDGILATMQKYYSERLAKPSSKPPSDAKPYSERQRSREFVCSLRASLSDGDWHVYFESDVLPEPMQQFLGAVERKVDSADAKLKVKELILSLQALRQER